eukprot:CAMPEP_0175077072 /NCGR_PEP_ID=MMETSP0052_2-20121109/23150_1 /TAXON_ID=51329 ORGANISM="Polytomella parva, Strain SAG 63-3" /NCGR_SAMPLE_ID=MMETSP0052_2 /ASSEMBLY_ACC=CAM_ASM_000194 /LENGTH=127 /DNA_ID=CAMNT_0016346423 /DNA_START=513 /DNA_END=893 /DNA_ORIENTATION=+
MADTTVFKVLESLDIKSEMSWLPFTASPNSEIPKMIKIGSKANLAELAAYILNLCLTETPAIIDLQNNTLKGSFLAMLEFLPGSYRKYIYEYENGTTALDTLSDPNADGITSSSLNSHDSYVNSNIG